jgi:hypothetical protein
MKDNMSLVFSIAVFFALISLLLGVLLGISTTALRDADNRVTQLEKINKMLDTRGKTDVISKSELATTTTVKSFDTEVLEFCVDYNVAQRTYIDLLTGLLDSNHISYPEFAYEELLKENIQ